MISAIFYTQPKGGGNMFQKPRILERTTPSSICSSCALCALCVFDIELIDVEGLVGLLG